MWVAGVVVLLVSLEDGAQVWQLDVQLVHAELQLQGWDLEKLLLLLLVVSVLVGQDAGEDGEQGDEDKDLGGGGCRWRRLVSGQLGCFYLATSTRDTYLLVHFEFLFKIVWRLKKKKELTVFGL